MTPNQEDALHTFLENVTEPFTLEDVTEFVHMMDSDSARNRKLPIDNDSARNRNLPSEIAAFLNSSDMAFRADDEGQWLSRRGCFEDVPFVISPTRLELLNGILIPGHRCIPFANPVAMPHEYKFFWQDKEILWTTTEGPPEDFYRFYSFFGEEYAPQYMARDNPDNEAAFSIDPFEDPPEVSIHTLDMTNIFRETSFVPGDRFVVRTRDWKEAHFNLEKVGKDDWEQTELDTWFKAAEGGFDCSFSRLGPGNSTEEQIAFAYWYGGERMRDVPAYSLEEFLFEKTDSIENVVYGIASRFWFAGKDIPDSKRLLGLAVPPDKTFFEDILVRAGVPISEYVLSAYSRDALFRNEKDINNVMDRIIPPVITMKDKEWNYIADYVEDTMDELRDRYTLFLDQGMGPIRQRVGELHAAVVELAARLQKGEMDISWLPKHTFIMLSQIQGHAAHLLEDLDTNEAPPESELEAMDSSLDGMIDTFTDIKEMIDYDMNSFRRSNLMLVRAQDGVVSDVWRTMQICIGGTDVWRRVLVPREWKLADLHKLIQITLDWNDTYRHRFFLEGSGKSGLEFLDDKIKILEICDQGINELQYEYGAKWNIKVIILSPYQPDKKETIRCVAGEGASPPENIGGPLRFRKILNAIEGGSEMEKQTALHELGREFDPELFDIEKCNRKIEAAYSVDV
jgi:hypothetical protein